MLKRVTIQLPEEWLEALHAERQKASQNVSELVRQIVYRSLSSRGHSLRSAIIVPVDYDRSSSEAYSAKRNSANMTVA